MADRFDIVYIVDLTTHEDTTGKQWSGFLAPVQCLKHHAEPHHQLRTLNFLTFLTFLTCLLFQPSRYCPS